VHTFYYAGKILVFRASYKRKLEKMEKETVLL
jgi:hypothetical protein